MFALNRPASVAYIYGNKDMMWDGCDLIIYNRCASVEGISDEMCHNVRTCSVTGPWKGEG